MRQLSVLTPSKRSLKPGSVLDATGDTGEVATAFCADGGEFVADGEHESMVTLHKAAMRKILIDRLE